MFKLKQTPLMQISVGVRLIREVQKYYFVWRKRKKPREIASTQKKINKHTSSLSTPKLKRTVI